MDQRDVEAAANLAGREVMLPDSADGPPLALEQGGRPTVPLDVPLNLGRPVRRRARPEAPALRAPVPEAAVHEDNDPHAGEDDVRLSMKALAVDRLWPSAVR